jgi:two-component system chemotaxis sensor kinase CheA
MDVVKTNIERIGGTIDLASRAGEGTTIRVRIPLTLAIVPALLVVSGRQRFAIPQTNLLELVRLEGEAARSGIESVHGTPVHRLRGRLLPLVMLSHVVSGAPPIRHGDALYGRDGASILNIVVLQAGATQLGLVVDEVRDTEEIVVKPLGKELRGIALFAGATIMGDGRVALILDVAGLAQHVSSASRGGGENGKRKTESTSASGDSRQSEDALLLFEGERGGLTAVPVSRITRIEEFPRSRLERSGDNTVVQYRGAILPLIELAQLQAAGEDDVTVLVITEGKKSIGILVQKIVDVVEERYSVEHCTSRPGVLGTVVIQGRVTDLLDVNGVIGRKAPWFYREVAG